MLMVISPAKTLDYTTAPVTARHTLPEHLEHSAELIAQLRELTPAQIAELMHLSDKLAGLNAARFAQWSPDFTAENAKQALLAFKGDVYTGLDAESFSEDDFDFAQQHLRMLSGLYGVLRPLDCMLPYRLEMGTPLATTAGANLYQFWGTRIAEYLNAALQAQEQAAPQSQGQEAQGHEERIVVNLASQEYFKAVDRKALRARVIDCVFEDLKGGGYKIISFYAKRARGLMARYAITQRITTPAGLEGFALEGYAFARAASSAERLVFRREHPAGHA